MHTTSSRQKILYILTKSDTGGAQKYVHDLAKHLDPSRFESKILYGGKDVRWLSNALYPWFLFANDWLAVIELIRIFRREKPDVIHVNSSKAGVVGTFAAALYRIFTEQRPRIIFTAHGWVFNPTNDLFPFASWFYRVIHKVAAWFQDFIIAVSYYDRDLALRYRVAPASKLVTIHNGIDPTIPFLKEEDARKEIIKRLTPLYEFSDSLIHKTWIGSLGRLTKEKNYETLIKAASLIPEASFFIIGDGPEKEMLQQEINALHLGNRFFFVPPHGNDAVLLKVFDIFVLPSIKEGLPYSLLEAIAAGIPVIITEAGGMKDVAEEAKKLHREIKTIPFKNPEALAQEIRNLLQTEKPRACVLFPIKTMVESTIVLYTKQLQER